MDALRALLVEGRTRKNLSLRAVEQATGVSNAYLSQLEGGKVREPSPNILHRLSELYAIPYESLLEAAGYPVPSGDRRSESSRLAARLGPTTDAEDEALADYLAFLRSKTRGRKTR